MKYLPRSPTDGVPAQPARRAEGESCAKRGRENICGLSAGPAPSITLNGTRPAAAQEWTL